jgi:hypothetical protein
MPLVPEVSAEFSAPLEFFGGVLEKNLSRQDKNLRPSDYKPDTLPLRHCILMHKSLWHLLLDFPAVF